ncbi:MAG: hypothetical protein ACJ71P_00205 [Nitrososphaeraceae archaeon]|jgi:hypothetical protein
MPAAIEASIKTKVIQQWLSGDSRAKIAIDNKIGEGTVSSVVSDFKIGLDNSEFDSANELALQAKKQGLNLSDLASNFRLHNFIRASAVTEDELESFIARIHPNDLPHEKIVSCVNQLYDLSNEQSIPIQEVPNYIQQKLEEKQKIDQEVKEASDILKNKSVSIEAINEHIKLREKLNEHDLCTQDIDKLLNLLNNARECEFDSRIIVRKLRI